MEAGDLVVGEEIRTAEWETGTVEAVYIVTQPQPMYNFTVSAAHTYFVGDGQWLVHNACPQFIRAIPEDQIGTSQPFKLRRGEDGLSVFEGVTSTEVLAELPGGRVANTTVIIPSSGLPPGTQVVNTPAPGLSQTLSDAHRILIKPQDWSVDRFAKALKNLVGWD